MTEQQFTVGKWGHWEPLADGVCHCGQPLKYNLRAGYVGHADPAVNEVCAEPWPDVPNPTGYEVARRFAATLKRAGVALDRAVGIDA
jgi:hypothetical protein